MRFQHRADVLMRSIFITRTADSGNSSPSLCVCHLSDCLSLSNDVWFVFRVCLYLPASAALFYLCQFRRRDRGIMLSASRRDATRHPRQLLSNKGPLFQLTLFSWQHQTVYVLSAEVMSKQTPSDGKPNKKNYNFAKNQWKVKAAKAHIPTQLNLSLSNVWKLKDTHTHADFFFPDCWCGLNLSGSTSLDLYSSNTVQARLLCTDWLTELAIVGPKSFVLKYNMLAK